MKAPEADYVMAQIACAFPSAGWGEATLAIWTEAIEGFEFNPTLLKAKTYARLTDRSVPTLADFLDFLHDQPPAIALARDALVWLRDSDAFTNDYAREQRAKKVVRMTGLDTTSLGQMRLYDLRQTLTDAAREVHGELRRRREQSQIARLPSHARQPRIGGPA